jgi:hypothetical protein
MEMESYYKQMQDYMIQVLYWQPAIPMSWGLHNGLRDKLSISFDVQGYLFTGRVTVTYNEGDDLFDVTIGQEEFSRVFVDELVDFIDRKVETK